MSGQIESMARYFDQVVFTSSRDEFDALDDDLSTSGTHVIPTLMCELHLLL